MANKQTSVAPRNRLMAAFESESRSRVDPHLERIDFKLGDVVCEAGGVLNHAYFPDGAVLSFEAYQERICVCRDFAHLAVAVCRCMNIPARYANGFLGDIGVPPDPAPMDYNAWFEVFFDGRWFTFDRRHNTPRIGRITVARGRNATDIPLQWGKARREDD